MLCNEEVQAVPCAPTALVGEPDEVSGIVTVPSDDTRWPAQLGELSGRSLR
jgi:hypothetical protein